MSATCYWSYSAGKALAQRSFSIRMFLLLFTLAASLITFGQSQPDTVTFKPFRKLMVFQLKVNGSRQLNFIFDTGAGVTAIDSSTAEEIGLSPYRTASIGTAGSSVSARVSKASVAIGSHTVDTMELFAMNLSGFSKALKTKIDGFIGYDLLHRFTVEINSSYRYIALYSPDYFRYAGSASPVAFVIAANKHLMLPVTVKGNNGVSVGLSLILDSGSDEAVSLFGSTVEKYPALKGLKLKEVPSFAADGVATKNYAGKLPYLRIGNIEWKDIQARFVLDKRNVSSTAYAVDQEGRIGQGLLSGCNIIYDFKNSILYIERTRQ